MTQGIALRIASIAILVMAVAVGVIAVGVLVVAQATFSHLMVQAGESTDLARAMFNHSVVVVFAGATAVAAIVGVGLATLLAVRLARPLRETAGAARRLARGEYSARVERSGPEEMASLADSFNQMAESLEAQERMRREFIVNAAHELSTPLTNLQGYLEALRDGVIPASPEQFQSLQEEVERLVRLSHSLQMLAADEAGGGERLERTDLVPAVRTAIELARPSFDAKDIAFRVSLPATLSVRAHPDRLAQVLANLLQNAARYTPAGGTVQVNAESRAEDALVAIANSGDGIPVSDLPHVFERFYRVEKSRNRARGGAGIGLAIVKQLVESVGGQVGVESSAGLTRFWVTIPS